MKAIGLGLAFAYEQITRNRRIPTFGPTLPT